LRAFFVKLIPAPILEGGDFFVQAQWPIFDFRVGHRTDSQIRSNLHGACQRRSPMRAVMARPSDKIASPLRKTAADALRQARRLPIGHERNDLRQLAMGLLWLEKKNLQATAKTRIILSLNDLRS
jgi:hypothetical protein